MSAYVSSPQIITVDCQTADVAPLAGFRLCSQLRHIGFLPRRFLRRSGCQCDASDEVDETYQVNLSNPTESASILDGTGIGTIDDDDGPAVSINNVSVTEENATTVKAVFTLNLSAASPQAVGVSYATANGTATAGAGFDYTAASGSVYFTPGSVTQFITVTVLGDTKDEVNEYFYVNLSIPVDGTIADNQGVATIIDNDGPGVSVNDVTVIEGDGGSTTNAIFTVFLSASSPQTVTVNYITQDITATAPADYNTISGTLVSTQ
jgi:hypothetical protein